MFNRLTIQSLWHFFYFFTAKHEYFATDRNWYSNNVGKDVKNTNNYLKDLPKN